MSDTLVLCYHAVSEDWPAPLAVHPRQLSDQLELLVDRGYRGATFSQAVRERPAGKTLVVTFDDGFASVLEQAFETLSRLGLPGTIFAVSEFAASGRPLAWPGIEHWARTPHARELAGLDWDQLRRLTDSGWEVGSHTATHPHLTELDDRALERELRASREACAAAIGGSCTSIAYPYGDVDARVVDAAGAAGYSAGAALPARPHRRKSLEWPRTGVYRKDELGRFKLKASRLVRRARAFAGR